MVFTWEVLWVSTGDYLRSFVGLHRSAPSSPYPQGPVQPAARPGWVKNEWRQVGTAGDRPGGTRWHLTGDMCGQQGTDQKGQCSFGSGHCDPALRTVSRHCHRWARSLAWWRNDKDQDQSEINGGLISDIWRNLRRVGPACSIVETQRPSVDVMNLFMFLLHSHN